MSYNDSSPMLHTTTATAPKGHLTAAYAYLNKEQAVTSRATSRNQLPKIFKKHATRLAPINLDYGSGAYTKHTDYLATQGIENLCFDPFNLSQEDNAKTAQTIASTTSHSITCSNMLNVIQDHAVRAYVYELLLCKLSAQTIVISVYYETNRPAGATRDGYQLHKKTDFYLNEMESFLTDWNVKKTASEIVLTRKNS